MYIDKIKNAKEKGVLFWTIKRKIQTILRDRRKIYYVDNRNIRRSIQEYNVYKRMKKEFSNTIRRGAPKELVQSHADIIWVCWLQGFENAPELVKVCLKSIESNFPTKRIMILSNENIEKYIEIPKRIKDLYSSGKMKAAQYSDFIRVSLLCKWGGIWMDATVLCTSPELVNEISQYPLFVFKQMDLTRKDNMPINASSWFISADSNEKILVLTRMLLVEYWNKYDYAMDYFIFHILFSIAAERYSYEWDAIPCFNNHSPHVLQFELGNKYSTERWEQIQKISSIHKLNRHVCIGDDDSFYHYIVTCQGAKSSSPSFPNKKVVL